MEGKLNLIKEFHLFETTKKIDEIERFNENKKVQSNSSSVVEIEHQRCVLLLSL